MHNAACAMTRTSDSKRCALRAQVEENRSFGTNGSDGTSGSRITKVGRHSPSLSARCVLLFGTRLFALGEECVVRGLLRWLCRHPLRVWLLLFVEIVIIVVIAESFIFTEE